MIDLGHRWPTRAVRKVRAHSRRGKTCPASPPAGHTHTGRSATPSGVSLWGARALRAQLSTLRRFSCHRLYYDTN